MRRKAFLDNYEKEALFKDDLSEFEDSRESACCVAVCGLFLLVVPLGSAILVAGVMERVVETGETSLVFSALADSGWLGSCGIPVRRVQDGRVSRLFGVDGWQHLASTTA